MNNNLETGFLHIVFIFKFSISNINMHLFGVVGGGGAGGGGFLDDKFRLNICFQPPVRQFYLVYLHYYKINIIARLFSLATQ